MLKINFDNPFEEYQRVYFRYHYRGVDIMEIVEPAKELEVLVRNLIDVLGDDCEKKPIIMH